MNKGDSGKRPTLARNTIKTSRVTPLPTVPERVPGLVPWFQYRREVSTTVYLGKGVPDPV